MTIKGKERNNMEKETIRCSGCEHCGFLSPLRGSRNSFHCGHPDGSYINKYFREHGIRKMPGFLGYGKPYSREVPVKTSPAWCPRKQERHEKEKQDMNCPQYLGVACIDGYCPRANRDEYLERGMDVPESCNDCPQNRGCEDCYFKGTKYCDKRDTDFKGVVIHENTPDLYEP